MNRLRAIVLLLIMGMIASAAGAADFTLEFANFQGSTDNLLDDSNKIYDAYTTTTLRGAYYPLPSLEISIAGENSYYREVTGLSSWTGQLQATYLPLPDTSRLSVYLSGNVSGVRYHHDFSSFDNNSGEIEAAAGYALTHAISARAGVAYSSTAYIGLDVPYKRDLEMYLGSNISLPAEVSLDVEAGFARANFTYIVNDPDIILPFTDSLPNAQDILWTFFISPRLSRQIAPKTGLSLLFSQRNFQNYAQQIIYGFSTGYLSPWAAVWQGQEITANLKSYLIPHLIVTAGAGYWDKTYLRTAEEEHVYFIMALIDVARHDYESRYYLNIQWPITTRNHVFIEPNIRLDYTKNKSNKPLFYFDDFSISGAITVRL